jgi:hypothetical protein
MMLTLSIMQVQPLAQTDINKEQTKRWMLNKRFRKWGQVIIIIRKLPTEDL